MRALVADDNDGHSQLLAAILQSQGLSVDHAANGREALEAAMFAPYDLILMDVSMPQMDGLTATRMIRAHEAADHGPRTPIVIVTSHGDGADIGLSLAAGADGHVVKPVSVAGLLDVIAAACGPDRPGAAVAGAMS